MVSLEAFKEGKIPLLLLERGTVVVEDGEATFAVELDARYRVGSGGVGADDLMDSAVNQGLCAGVIESNASEALLEEAERAFDDRLVFWLERRCFDQVNPEVLLNEANEVGLAVTGLAVMQESVGEDATEGVDRETERLGNAAGTLVVVDDNSGVTAGGLIDDGLPVEVEELIRGKEVDINALAVGDEHGARSQWMSFTPEAEGLARSSRDRNEDPEDPFDLGAGEVELSGGMTEEVASNPLPALPLVGDVAYQLGCIPWYRQRLLGRPPTTHGPAAPSTPTPLPTRRVGLLLGQAALAIELEPIRDGVERDAGGGSEGVERALPLVVQ